MNRLDRGYSFEALRAKILFTEGIHKTRKERGKFQRRDKRAFEKKYLSFYLFNILRGAR